MLVRRHPVGQFVSARFEVTRTAQLFGTEALGHPARDLRDVTKLCRSDEDALDAKESKFGGRLRASRRIRRWSGHTERLSAPESVVRGMGSQFARETVEVRPAETARNGPGPTLGRP